SSPSSGSTKTRSRTSASSGPTTRSGSTSSPAAARSTPRPATTRTTWWPSLSWPDPAHDSAPPPARRWGAVLYFRGRSEVREDQHGPQEREDDADEAEEQAADRGRAALVALFLRLVGADGSGDDRHGAEQERQDEQADHAGRDGDDRRHVDGLLLTGLRPRRLGFGHFSSFSFTLN